MSRLIFLLGVICSLQNGFARPSSSSSDSEGGIYFEYNPPPAKSESDLFIAILEPTSGSNVTVAQFMYHLKHTTYATAFMTEIFTLGIGTHLFTNDLMENPSEEDRRIAYTVGKLWTTLPDMLTINRLALRVSNETAHRYLRNKDRNDTIKYIFSRLNDAIMADPMLNQTYAEDVKNVDVSTLPPLDFIGINMTKFGSIERLLLAKVWPNPKSFHLITHARFSQHLETKVPDATGEDFKNVLTAHLLVDAASLPETKEMAQNAYNDATALIVKASYEYPRLAKIYEELDNNLFKMIRMAVKEYPMLDEKMMELMKNYQSTPTPEV